MKRSSGSAKAKGNFLWKKPQELEKEHAFFSKNNKIDVYHLCLYMMYKVYIICVMFILRALTKNCPCLKQHDRQYNYCS